MTVKENIISNYQKEIVDGHVVEFNDTYDKSESAKVRAKVPYEEAVVPIGNLYNLLSSSVSPQQLLSRISRATNASLQKEFEPLFMSDIIESKLDLFEENDQKAVAQMAVTCLRRCGFILPKVKEMCSRLAKN